MKSLPLLLLLASATASATGLAPSPWLESSLQPRVGFDSNPDGTSGTSAVAWGGADTLTYAVVFNVGATLRPASAERSATKLTYTSEAVRFDRWSGENFSTHRLGASGQINLGLWKISGDASSLFVAGSRDTLMSVSSVNANAITLWRERRRQWQHRAKLTAQAAFGEWLVRGTGSLLAYDYDTKVVAGKVAFADRSDVQAGVDLGRRQNANSLWLAGVRAGHQTQAVVPLPNCDFDYSSDYTRVVAGWEGRLAADTTASVSAGPDFRHYTGAIDSRVFTGGRDRTSLWFESALTAKPLRDVALTAKAVRMTWLSSTGKSAYTDTCTEAAASWNVSSAHALRLTAKWHRCDYFPLARDDEESLVGVGATLKYSPAATFAVDALSHHAWGHLATTPEREFRRVVVNFGASIRL